MQQLVLGPLSRLLLVVGATGRRPERRLPFLAPLLLALAACGVAHPWPSQTPRSEPHVVLMVGDSYLGQTDATMVESLGREGFAATTIVDAHINGSGLVSPVPHTLGDGRITWYDSALDWTAYQLDAHPEVDTVVIEYGGACWDCDQSVSGSLVYGSDEFYDAWRARAHELIDYVRSRGKLVLWTISPKSGTSGDKIASGSRYTADIAERLSIMDRMELCPAADGCVDWWTPLVDLQDRYQAFLAYDGAWHKVRFDDLVHLVRDGSLRTSTWTVSALGTLWAAREAPGDVEAFGTPAGPQLIEGGDPVVLP
jgi:hypothetical protein